VPIDGHAIGKGSIRHREFPMASGEMDAGQFSEFLTSACSLLAQNSRDGAIHFVCMDWRHMAMLAAGTAVYSELKRTCAVG